MKRYIPLLFLISIIFIVVSEGIILGYQVFTSDASSTESTVFFYLLILVISSILFILHLPRITSNCCEESARYTLDCLPIKFMLIESENSRGLISENEMKRQKNIVQCELNYYGALDGVSRIYKRIVKIALGLPLLAGIFILLFDLTRNCLAVFKLFPCFPQEIILTGYMFLLIYGVLGISLILLTRNGHPKHI